MKSIVDVVHKEDCAIFVQIHHAGVTRISENPLCPSPYKYKTTVKNVVGREMTIEGINSIQNDSIEDARRAYEYGKTPEKFVATEIFRFATNPCKVPVAF